MIEFQDKILTPDDVCKMLQISKSTLARLLAKREIKPYKVGGRNRFKLSEIEEYLRKNYQE